MIQITDQIGCIVTLEQPAKRIISLVPSQTELLHTLGLENETVGITKFCVHPERWFKQKTRIGGTKQINIEQIKALQPDLVLANKEENVQEQIEMLRQFVPVYVSDVHNLASAFEMMHQIGVMTNTQTLANHLVEGIGQEFSSIPSPRINKKVIYLIWRNPYMSVGGDTFIHEMITAAGLENLTEKLTRYPTLTAEQIAGLQPDILLLSSEPYPFQLRHVKDIKQLLPELSIQLVDGELFSWYGSRLLHTPQYLKQLQWELGMREHSFQ